MPRRCKQLERPGASLCPRFLSRTKAYSFNFPLARRGGQPGARALGRLDVESRGLGLGSCGYRAGAEAAERTQSVVHEDCAGGHDIEGEGGGDAHEMLATSGKLRRERAALRSEHVGGPQRMGKAWKINGLLKHLDTDEAAPLGQGELGRVPPVVKLHMRLCPRSV